MRRTILGVLALVLTAGTVASAQTEEEQREMRRRLQELREEIRDLEQRLGENRFRFSEPLVLSIGNRGRLGVIVNTESNSETDRIGAVLQAVTPDGPADNAGLEAGDIIVTMNGESLLDTGRWQSPGDKLVELAGELEVGDTVHIEYERDGDRGTATVVAGRVSGLAYSYGFPGVLEIDTNDVRGFVRQWTDGARDLADRVRVQRWDGDGPFVISMSSQWSDMELTTLDEDLGSYFGTTEGLLVVRAPEEDFLELRSGDVILRIGGRVPSSPSHAIRILRSYETGDEIRMDIMRHQQRETITVTVPERDRGLFWEDR